MRIRYRDEAPANSVFAPDAFASQVGKEVPLHVGFEPRGTAQLISARVAADGLSAELEIDTSDHVAEVFAAPLGPFRLG